MGLLARMRVADVGRGAATRVSGSGGRQRAWRSERRGIEARGVSGSGGHGSEARGGARAEAACGRRAAVRATQRVVAAATARRRPARAAVGQPSAATRERHGEGRRRVGEAARPAAARQGAASGHGGSKCGDGEVGGSATRCGERAGWWPTDAVGLAATQARRCGFAHCVPRLPTAPEPAAKPRNVIGCYQLLFTAARPGRSGPGSIGPKQGPGGPKLGPRGPNFQTSAVFRSEKHSLHEALPRSLSTQGAHIPSLRLSFRGRQATSRLRPGFWVLTRRQLRRTTFVTSCLILSALGVTHCLPNSARPVDWPR